MSFQAREWALGDVIVVIFFFDVKVSFATTGGRHGGITVPARSQKEGKETLETSFVYIYIRIQVPF